MEIYYIFIGIILIAAFYFDAKTSTIPNRLTVGGALLGLLYHLLKDGLEGLFFAGQGMIIAFGILLVLHILRAVGAGDVKLFAAVGAFTGTGFVLSAIFYSMIFAALVGIVLLLVKGRAAAWLRDHLVNIYYYLVFRNRPRKEQGVNFRGFNFPFMYGVLPGVIFTYYMLYIAF